VLTTLCEMCFVSRCIDKTRSVVVNFRIFVRSIDYDNKITGAYERRACSGKQQLSTQTDFCKGRIPRHRHRHRHPRENPRGMRP